MKMFGFKKEKKPCCCGGACSAASMGKAEEAKTEGASVKVLGSGCSKCNALEASAREALAELGMDTTIDHVTDFAQIASYGVMTTPALVVDGQVIVYGKVPGKDELVALIRQCRG